MAAAGDIRVRLATSADAEGAIAAIRGAILELCAADHGGDPAVLDSWLENKTPAHFRDWLTAPQSVVVVAVDGAGRVAGAAGCTDAGDITLNYVAPHARFRGVSKALIAWIEDHLRGLGVLECRLTSTKTAHRFYRAAGFSDAGAPVPWRGMMALPMRKRL